MRRTRDFWNFTASILFIFVFSACAWLMLRFGDISTLIRLAAIDIVIVSLAAFRLIHLFTYDKIFNFVREVAAYESKNGSHVAARVASRVASDMLECLWCTGIWSSLFVITLYSLGTWGRLVTLVLAIAGAGSLLQVFSRTIASLEKKENV